MINPQQNERRKHPRMSVHVPFKNAEGENKLTCYLKDISRVGAAAVVNHPVEEMSRVLVETVLGGGDLPTIEISEEAVVVRCDFIGEDEYEIGLFFQHMPVELRDAIDYFIDQALLLNI